MVLTMLVERTLKMAKTGQGRKSGFKQKHLLMNSIFKHLLDLIRAVDWAQEGSVLNIFPPQPLTQLVQLLHAQGGQLTRERAALLNTREN